MLIKTREQLAILDIQDSEAFRGATTQIFPISRTLGFLTTDPRFDREAPDYMHHSVLHCEFLIYSRHEEVNALLDSTAKLQDSDQDSDLYTQTQESTPLKQLLLQLQITEHNLKIAAWDVWVCTNAPGTNLAGQLNHIQSSGRAKSPEAFDLADTLRRSAEQAAVERWRESLPEDICLFYDKATAGKEQLKLKEV